LSDASDLGEFPRQRIYPDRELYRIHRVAHGPLWFAVSSNKKMCGNGGDWPAVAARVQEKRR
jgi:hypothetical protein